MKNKQFEKTASILCSIVTLTALLAVVGGCARAKSHVLGKYDALMAVVDTKLATLTSDDAKSGGDGGIILGTYHGAIREKSTDATKARIKIDETIDALRAANVNTFAYVLDSMTSGVDWESLDEFVVKAKKYDIKVMVHLVPPAANNRNRLNPYLPGTPPNWRELNCTKSTYPPFENDYMRWVTEIAKKSILPDHEALTTVAIDDLGHAFIGQVKATCDFFDAKSVREMTAAMHAINPKLEFMADLYGPEIFGTKGEIDVASQIRPFTDGVIYPYRDFYNRNTIATSTEKNELVKLGALLSCRRDFLATTRGKSACFQFHLARHHAVAAGQYASISQPVALDGKVPAGIKFYVQQNYDGDTKGYVFVQLLVTNAGGKPIKAWEKDLADMSALAWQQVSLDLSKVIVGKSATLEFRIQYKKEVSSFGNTVFIDSVEGTDFQVKNGAFDNGSLGWTKDRTNTSLGLYAVQTVKVIPMLYASPLSAPRSLEHPNPPPLPAPTDAYFTTVLTEGLRATKAGYADGTMAYRVDLTPRPSCKNCSKYDIMQSSYGNVK